MSSFSNSESTPATVLATKPMVLALYFTTFSTRFGPFSAAINGTGEIVASAFGDERALRRRVPRAIGDIQLFQDESRTAHVREQVMAYSRGARRDFELELAPPGTPYQQRVWDELVRIPFGEIRAYADLARTLRSSPRAVGGANGANPICMIIPCHRVIGADGSLTGFAFGEAIKRALLEHEGALAS